MRYSGPVPHTLLTFLALMAGLLAVPPGAASAAPAMASSEQLVRLTADPGSGVRAATVPLPGPRTGVLRTAPFSLVALTWRGADPRLQLRTRAVGGRWSGWRAVEAMHDEADRAERRTSTRGSDLLWVGPADRVQVRPARAGAAAPRHLELVLIDPVRRAADAQAKAQGAGTAPQAERAVAGRARTASGPPKPRLHNRNAWGADASWRNGTPTYNTGLSQVHVHHTATGNDYARADVPGILRGMYRYHTRSLGWFDIGYNFLVDRFGRAWIGRSGGPSRPVRGAHTLGFNHNSTGIAVIGNFTAAAPTRPALRAVANIAAWKLGRHQRPRATGYVGVRSTGSDRYAAGRRVRLPVIDGHRDTNQTACPGQRLYDRLGWIRRTAQARMTRYR